MKNKFISLLALSTSYLVLSTHVLAQTPSATESSSIRDSVKQKVAEELAQIKKAVAKRAFVGVIISKSEATLTLTNLKNQSRTVTITTDTTVKLLGGKEATPKDVKVGDFVIVMGDVDSQNTMTGKRLIVISKPVEDQRRMIFGTITKSTATTLELTDPSQKTWTVKTSATVKLTNKTKLSSLKAGDKIIVIGTLSSANAATAKIIHLVVAIAQ